MAVEKEVNKMEITKDTGIVIILKTITGQNLDELEQSIHAHLDGEDSPLPSLGYELKINRETDEIIIKVVQDKESDIFEKRTLYKAFAFIVEILSGIQKELNNIINGIISVDKIVIAEKSAKSFISEHEKFPRIMLDDLAFSFINDDMINIYTEDKEDNKLNEWGLVLTPDEMMKKIKKDEFHYISTLE